jgi:tetratricopeptide (TPR) repeat protein
MDSSGAVYAQVPAGGVDALEAGVREARLIGRNSSPLAVLAYDPAVHSFALVDRWGRPDDMPHWAEDPDLELATELAALSRLVGEVIAFYEVDEGTTMGIYAAWRDGVLVRNLQWAADRWECVEGEPQSWDVALFTPQALQNALDDARDREQVRTLFDSKRIVLHATWPRPEGISVSIRTVHPAPAFGFSPWPRRKELEKRNQELDAQVRKPAPASPPPQAPAPSPTAIPRSSQGDGSTKSSSSDDAAARMFAPYGERIRDLGRRARASMAAGRFEDAMADFEQIMVISPVSAEGILGKAAALINQGRHASALDWLEELSSRRDLEPMRSFMIAVAADHLGDAVKAEKIYRGLKDSPDISSEKRALCARRTTELAPVPAVLLAGIDDVAEQLPDLADAVAAYEQFSMTHPELAQPFCERGVGMTMLGRHDEALRCFDRAIAVDPALSMAYDHKAVTLLRLERLDEAIQTLDQGLQHSPGSGLLMTRKGIALTRCGRLAEALKVLEQSLAQDPGEMRAWAYKGDVESKLGDTAAAIASIRQFLALRFVHKEHKIIDGARRQLWAIENPNRKRYPDHGVACLEASLRAEIAGRTQEALELLEEGLAADPLSGKLWFNCGALLRALNRFDEALVCLERAEELLGPGLVLNAQAELLLAMGRPEDALRCHERALEPDPANFFALHAKAATLVRLGRNTEAYPIYQRLVSRTPRDASLLMEYSKVKAAILEVS